MDESISNRKTCEARDDPIIIEKKRKSGTVTPLENVDEEAI